MATRTAEASRFADIWDAAVRAASAGDAPVVRLRHSAWMVSGAAAVDLLRDESAVSADIRRWSGYALAARPVECITWRERCLLAQDGDVHRSRRRALVRGLASADEVDRRVGDLAEIADALLRESLGDRRQHFDVLDEFAYPFAGQAIGRWMGIPAADVPACVSWSRALAPLLGLTFTVKDLIRANHALVCFREYLTGRLPAMAGGLDPETAVDDLVLLFGAGHETVALTITNAALAIAARHHHHDDRDPDRAVRDWSSVQATCRVATRRLTVGGETIDARDLVVIVLQGSGAVFGAGPHACPGATLARAEVAVALDALRRHAAFDRIDAGSVHARRPSFFRGPDAAWARSPQEDDDDH